VRLGYLGWLALMAGVVAILRTSGRGRRGWEPATLVLLACVPPVFMAVQRFFHPEDLLAMALALCGLACVRRGWWGWAGVALGLAVTSQQFALLVLAPLFVVVPRSRRLRFTVSAIGAAAVVVFPLVAITSGRVVQALTGAGVTPSTGRTLLSIMHFHGLPLFALSRILPLLLGMALALWAVRRLGLRVLEPIGLTSLIATSLAFRLVFEVNLFGYYFMAVAVCLVLLDVLSGRIRGRLVVWLALVTFAFDPLPWGHDPLIQAVPIWLWQIVLVPSAVVLAVGPLLSAAQAHRRWSLDPIDADRAEVALEA
jgi:uncharacterized membrane protein